jgi:uncharacterized protein
MTKNKIGLPNDKVEILFNILAYYPTIQTVKVFGSRAKGDYHKLSDLDLVVIGTGQDKISSILSDIDQSDFLYKVDIIGYDSTIDNELLKSEIDNYCQDFWERDETKINQEILKLSQNDVWFDKNTLILKSN